MTLRDYAEKPDKSSRPPARKNTLSQSDEVMSAGLSDPSLATPQKLMQLQRTLGNQAVMRFLAQQDSQSATDSATSIRRYTERTATNPEMQEWVSKFQRSSANGGILQISEQYLVARDDIIEASEVLLAKQASVVQLVKGEVFTPGYSRVRLQVRESRIADLKKDSDPRAKALGDTAKDSAKDKIGKLGHSLHAAIENNKHSIQLNKESIQSSEGLTAEAIQNMVDENVGREQSNRGMGGEQRELDKMSHTGVTDLFMTIRDCHMTARLVMGDVGRGGIAVWKEQALSSDPLDGGKEAPIGTGEKQHTMNTVGNLTAIGLLKHAYSSFGEILDRRIKQGNLEPSDAESLRELKRRVEGVHGAYTYKSAMTLYADIQKHKIAGSLFNQSYSINEHAKIAVGQALVQVNEEDEYQKSNSGNLRDDKDQRIDLWNFHWAGVILMDGADYVTLEAVADAAASGLTANWMFRMYGAGAQSFHSENEKDEHVGSAPMTLGIKAPVPVPTTTKALPRFGGGSSKVGLPPIMPPTGLPPIPTSTPEQEKDKL